MSEVLNLTERKGGAAMRKLSSLALVVLAAVAMCHAQQLAAQDNYLGAPNGTTVLIVNEAKTPEATNENACDLSQCGCQNACNACDSDFPLACSCCPTVSLAAGFGIDSFHSESDRGPSNFGAVAGLNGGMPVPGLRDYGIGWQLGMSYGVYDWDGRSSYYSSAASQQQIFVTTGFFHKAQEGQRLSYGMVYDWMLNDNYSYYPIAPTLGQWRGQIEYAVSNRNAFGVYGTLHDLASHTIQQAYVESRAINQCDIFWHHKFDQGADSRLWFGLPDHSSYTEGDSLLDWIIGAQVEVPLSENLALVASGQYGHPCSSANANASMDQYYDISAGVIWYIGGHAKKASINGGCWQPYLPTANNSTFLVEQRSIL
jgi:hypothetical protein